MSILTKRSWNCHIYTELNLDKHRTREWRIVQINITKSGFSQMKSFNFSLYFSQYIDHSCWWLPRLWCINRMRIDQTEIFVSAGQCWIDHYDGSFIKITPFKDKKSSPVKKSMIDIFFVSFSGEKRSFTKTLWRATKRGETTHSVAQYWHKIHHKPLHTVETEISSKDDQWT